VLRFRCLKKVKCLTLIVQGGRTGRLRLFDYAGGHMTRAEIDEAGEEERGEEVEQPVLAAEFAGGEWRTAQAMMPKPRPLAME
jgi:hypothetical protein